MSVCVFDYLVPFNNLSVISKRNLDSVLNLINDRL